MNKSKKIYEYIQNLEREAKILDNLYNSIVISASYKGIVLSVKDKSKMMEMIMEFCEKQMQNTVNICGHCGGHLITVSYQGYYESFTYYQCENKCLKDEDTTHKRKGAYA